MERKKKIRGWILSVIILSCLAVPLVLLAVLGGKEVEKKPEKYVQTAYRPNVEWYDENGTEFIITTADQLYELVQLSRFYNFTGQTIKLGADIVINEGNAQDWAENAPGRNWYPIIGFAGTFDGQGHTISGIYMSSADISTGVFAGAKAGSVIRNFKLVNSYFYSWGSMGTSSIASNSSGTFQKIYSDAIVYCENSYAAGMFSKPQDGAVIEECWFAGNVYLKERFAGGIADIARSSRLTIEHCLNTGFIESPWSDSAVSIGGMCGVAMDKDAKLKINDCLNAGEIKVVNTFRVGAIVGGGNDKAYVDVRNAYATKESYVLGIGNVIYNNTGGAIRLAERWLKGINGYCWTTLDFDNYWSAVNGETPVLKCFATEEVSVANAQKMFSFDWYDENAKEYTLNTAKDLYGFTLISHTTNFRDKTVRLGADITVNKGTATTWAKTAPALEWMPIQLFAGTFDGRGHTIAGIYAIGESGVGLFEKTNKYSTIKNLKLENSYFFSPGGAEGYAFVGSIIGRGGGLIDTVYSDAIVEAASLGAGGFIGQMNLSDENNKITNSWFAGTVNMLSEEALAGGGMVGSSVQGKLTIEHCLNTGEINSEVSQRGAKVGGFVANLEFNKAKLAVKDSLSVGKISTKNQYYVGSIIGVACASTSASVDKSYAATESYVNSSGQHISVNISGTGTVTGAGIPIDRADLIGYSGYQWTELDFSKYWAVDLDGTPMLKSFAKSVPSLAGINKLFDASWYNEKNNVYVLDSKEDLYGFTLLSKTTDFAGKTVRLSANIVVNEGTASDWLQRAPESKWTPIASFAGTFDGQGYMISGLYVNAAAQSAGMFAEVTGTVKNLKIANSYLHSTEDVVGSVAGWGKNATFKNIYSTALVSSDKGIVGGIVGRLGGTKNAYSTDTVKECWFDGEVKAATTGVGGLVGGMIYTNTKISDSLNSGKVISATVSNTFAGGLCGYINMGGNLKVKDSLNTGSLQVEDNAAYVGSLVGYIGSNLTYKFADTYTTASSYKNIVGNGKQADTVKVEEDYLMGIRGYILTGFDFENIWAVREKESPALKAWVADELEIAGIEQADTKWYTDKTAILDQGDLLGFMKLAFLGETFEGEIIEIGANIKVNAGDASLWTAGNAPGIEWIPIPKFAGTFNGKGHTISGIYINDTTRHSGIFRVVTGTVKNLKLTNSYIYSTNDRVGSIAGNGQGATFQNIYSNALVVAKAGVAGGIVGLINTNNSVFEECWFDGKVTAFNLGAGGILGGALMHGTIKNCLNTGEIISTYNDPGLGAWAGGLCGYNNMGATLDIRDSINVGKINVVTGATGYGSINGGSMVADGFTISNVYASVQSSDKQYGGSRAPSEAINKFDETAYSGVGGYQFKGLTLDDPNTTDIREGVWVIRTGKVPALAKWVPKKEKLIIDTSWYTNGSKEIKTRADFFGFAKLALDGKDFKADTIRLGADIKVNSISEDTDVLAWAENVPDYVWIPISRFAGTFDGQGHTISGIYVNDTVNYSGMFRKVTGTVQNLRLSDSYFYSTAERVGSISGYGEGATFKNIYSNAIVIAEKGVAGGMVGRIEVTESKFAECWFEGKVMVSNLGAGGILGGAFRVPVTIENCLNTGEIASTYNDSGNGTWVGGLCGYNNLGAVLTIRDSINAGKITVVEGAMNYGAINGASTVGNGFKISNVYASIQSCSRTYGGGVAPDKAIQQFNAEVVKDANVASLTGLKFDNPKTSTIEGAWVARKGKVPALTYWVPEDEKLAAAQ